MGIEQLPTLNKASLEPVEQLIGDAQPIIDGLLSYPPAEVPIVGPQEVDLPEPTAEDLMRTTVPELIPDIQLGDSVRTYLNEMGAIPRISAQDEMRLGKQLAEGKQAADRLSREEYDDALFTWS